jgi:alanine dehydrogenase
MKQWKEDRTLPLLNPMSEIAGRMAPLMAAFYLARTQGGRGLLPTGATGVAPAEALVLGGGVVGANAARVAAGLGARVTVLDINLTRLERLGEIMLPNVVPLYNDQINLENGLRTADFVIGAVLIPGSVTPKLVPKEHLKIMKPGSVLVDMAIDQGGCFESSRATTHSDPVYVTDRIIHYCVANQYAGRLRPHIHLRTEQRHPPLRTGTGRQGRGKCLAGKAGHSKWG